MATKVAQTVGERLADYPPEEAVVITGVAGYYPDSDNVREFADNLFNKVDLVTEDDRRFISDHPEIPQRCGKINFLEKFDASFFGVHYKQAHAMDPMCRILMEKAYEAIIDAGMHPKEFRDKKTGVFIGSCFSESEKNLFYEKIQIDGFGITGCSRAMYANRISYWLNVTGPSYCVDTACSSSMYALEHAFRAMRDGICDSAIVGGANLCLTPYVTLQFARLGVLSAEGKCRSFDEDCTGYVRSEAISVILLQKAKDARRHYCTVCYAKTNCDGYKPEGITYPSGKQQRELFRTFYEDCKIPPENLAFMEAHGTGTKVGDPEELNAIDDIFCKKRTTPLKIGSIKSNIGHSEPASGICSITKCLIAFESGYIPPNLHFNKPRQSVEAFKEGRLQVVADKTELDGDLIGVNSFGFGGANCHVLLKRNPKVKINNGLPEDDIPRLVAVSGRTMDAVNTILDDLEQRPIDAEYIRLFHEIHREPVTGHIYRGYTLIEKNDQPKPTIVGRESDHYTGEKRPVWFVFSGMGSQWVGMGTSLLKIPVFAEAIKKCDVVLKPKGLDIYKIITEEDPKMFENILNSFVGIAAIQIGLVDVLTSLGIVPDHLIGHSVGELGCAYADGCFTAEQMILSAYSRGLVSLETELIHGAMAAVGLGYKNVKDLCPPDIDVACHNSADSSTISGPAESMKAFVADLQAKGIFAREVNASNIAYHSRYIADAGPKLLKALQKVIPKPVSRSEKWVTSSVPVEKQNTELAKYSSAEYHTNNLLSPVLFEESSRAIQSNAIAIEIAPHGLLQAILRRSLPTTVVNISLTQRGKDNTKTLLTALGKLYMQGLQPDLVKLYPDIEFPVSRGTPMISPLVRWEHTDDWLVSFFGRKQSHLKSGEREVTIRVTENSHYEYIKGHNIDGRNLFPATAYIMLVLDSLALMRGEVLEDMCAVMEDIRFIRATNVPKDSELEMIVMIQKGSGTFEIIESETAVVTGKVTFVENTTKDVLNLKPIEPTQGADLIPLTTRDVYKELRLRGYNYQGEFRGIQECDISGSYAKIRWANNWTTFIDSMMQLQIVNVNRRGLYVPTSIQKLVFDPRRQRELIHTVEDGDKVSKYVDAYYYPKLGVIKAGGIEVRGLKANSINRRKTLGEPVLERQEFIPYKNNEVLALEDALRCCVQTALENSPAIKVKVVEFDNGEKDPIAMSLLSVLGDLPLIQADISIISTREFDFPQIISIEENKPGEGTNAMFVVENDLSNRPEALEEAKALLKEGGFIISREDDQSLRTLDGYDIIVESCTDTEKIVLIRPKTESEDVKTEYINVTDDRNFEWLEKLKSVIQSSSSLVLYSQNESTSGLIGLVNSLRREPSGSHVRGVLIVSDDAPPFDPHHPFYKEQLDQNLAINIYKDGEWCCLRHLQLDPSNILTKHAYVDVLTRGDLSSLAWIEGPMSNSSDSTIIEIYYSALNFRDVMTSTGKLSTDFIKQTLLSSECTQGLEYSGRDVNGKRVMGMVGYGALATRINCDPCMVWEVPEPWSLQEAATVPIAFGTVYYALVYKGQIQHGQSILIHAGSGGVGQAAIYLALWYKCTIFTTVGTQEKRDFIRKNFPEIPESHIGNSRDTSFEQMIMRETKGKGVDIVLNSLAEEKLQASLRCLGIRGKFLEIGKYDLSNNAPLGMQIFLKETSFHGIMLDNIFFASDLEKRRFRELIVGGLKNGAIRPIKYTVFSEDEVEQAFRFMAAGKHIGKVLINIRSEEPDKIIAPKERVVSALPRLYCNEHNSYVIVGGLGGFGLELTNWLLVRGARKIVLSSRNGVRKGYQALRLKKWRELGIQIKVSTADVTTVEGCTALLHTAKLMGPVDGIFNLAAVLRDSLIENQTVENYKIAFGGKAYGTKNLDEISRKMCPELRHFVVFSSVACGRGNAGQSNYAMANSIMERICEQRHAEGLPGLAVQWGAIGEVGLVADMQENDTVLEIGGTLQQKIHSCLSVLDKFLKQSAPVVASMVVAEKKIGSGLGKTIVECVADIMGIRDIKTISMHSSLAELGMDSMMAVEIKQTLEREYEVFLTAQDIRTLTFNRLQEIQSAQEIDQEAENQTGADNIATLIRVLGDEKLANQILVKMTSLNTASPDAPPVFFIAGIEGQCMMFDKLCKQLKALVFGLQMGFEQNADTIEGMADILYPVVVSNINPEQEFHLVAYSYGSLIAIELAMKLEAANYKGRLLFIDGAPSVLKSLLNNQLAGGVTEDQLQAMLLCAIMNRIAPINLIEFKADLDAVPDWPSKVEIFLTRCPSDARYSTNYQRALCLGSLARIKALANYQPDLSRRIKSHLSLVRPQVPTVVDTKDDYDLSAFTDNQISVTFLDGNHFTILDNPKLVDVIDNYFVQH